MALARVLDCCFQSGVLSSAEPRSGMEGEMSIQFPISLELGECLWHKWMSPEQVESDQPNPCRHWDKLSDWDSPCL